ncbi:MAG: hypothetical protein NC548_35180 [Lachnospiraceae bacterium]|nr:hypothetical protein [Lachnospiraceae bacterium]
MDFEDFKKVVQDGGGFPNVAALIFDNSILFIKDKGLVARRECQESDFKKLGSEWFYKEPVKFRDNVDFEYNIDAVCYHPMSCLQGVIMMKAEDFKRVDINSVNSMV